MLDSPRDRSSPGGRVLVVDDDPKFVDIVVRCLERAGYECVTGESGDHALWAVVDHRPDVIVLDVMMPHPSGIDVCRHLRADGWSGGVVIVSARSSDPDRATAERAGADIFLAKPFPLAELLAAVETLVRPGRRIRDPAGSTVPGAGPNETANASDGDPGADDSGMREPLREGPE